MRAMTLLRALALALATTLISTQFVAAAVWTAQQDYSPGSVVTISGDNSNNAGYLPGETVHVDVAGPNGWTSQCDGAADDQGAWSCQVTLSSDPAVAGGDYSYTATGQTSGVSETGTFTDNTGITITAATFVWHKANEAATGFDVPVAGTYTCNSSGGPTVNCTAVASITLTVSTLAGSKVLSGPFTVPTTGGAWSTTLHFRTSGVDFFVPAPNARYSITAVMDGNQSAADPTTTATNYFGYDTVAPISTITCNAAACAGVYSSDVTVRLTATDPGAPNTFSGVASTDYCVDSINTCAPNLAYPGSGGTTVTRVSGATKYVRYFATDAAGNVETPINSQAITFNTDTTTATVVKAGGNPITTAVPATLVYDTAIMSAASGPTITGTVTYTLYNNGTCTPGGSGQNILSTQNVPLDGSGNVPDSNAATHGVGNYSYRAVYSGDTNYATSNGACEPFSVALASTTTGTVVMAGLNPVTVPVALNTTVHDTATVTGNVGPAITGTVTYNFYNNLTCTGAPAGSELKTMSGGIVPDSSPLTPNAGSHAYQAVYSGDTNYATSTGACEPFSVNQATPTIATAPKNAADNGTVFPLNSSAYDTATVGGQVGSFSLNGATVTYAFYANGTCTAPASTTQDVTVAGDLVPNSSATGALVAGSYSFKATYNGNTNYASASEDCESFSVAKATPTLTTDLSGVTSGIAALGVAVHDSAALGGQVDSISLNHTASLTYTLTQGLTCTGTVLGTDTATVQNNGTVQQSSTQHLPAGDYSYQAYYSGNANYTDQTSDCEPFSVAKADTTTATALLDATNTDVTGTTVQAPVTVHDTATVGTQVGTFVIGGGVTYQLFSTIDCAGSHTDELVTMAVGLVPDSSTHTFSLSGALSFNAVYGGDSNYNGSTSTCETLTVNAAVQTTVDTEVRNAADNTANTEFDLATSVYDHVALTPSGAEGTVNFELYRVDAGLSCSGNAADLVSSKGIAASGGTADGSASAALHAGDYYFLVTFTSDDTSKWLDITTPSCEPFTVNQANLADFTTQIHHADESALSGNAALGDNLHDSATATGVGVAGFEPTGDVTFTFYGTNSYGNTGTPICALTDNSTSAGTVSLDGADPGTADPSNSTGALHAGNYAFDASYSGDADYYGTTSGCEQFTVAKADLTLGTTIHLGDHTTSQTSVALGSTPHDSAAVSGYVGGFVPTGNVSFTFYGSNLLGNNNAADCNVVGTDPTHSLGTVALDSSGVADPSNATAALHAGSFAFDASYAGDSDYNGTTSSCEPLTVNKANLASFTTAVHNAGHVVVSAPVALGSTLHDSAAATGIGVSGFTPTGNVSFTFYGSSALGNSNTGNCLDPNSATAGTFGLISGAVDPSNSVGPLHAGGYAFSASYAGSADYNETASSCEPFSVNKANLTSLTTAIHLGSNHITDYTNGSVALGSTPHDSATATGNGLTGFTPTGNVVFRFYGTNTAGNSNVGDCTDPGSPLGTVALDLNGVADPSAATAALHAGKFGFRAYYAGSADYNSMTTGCEKLTVNKGAMPCTVVPYNVTYDTFSHTATLSPSPCLGTFGEDLSGSYTLSGTTHTVAGDYPNDPWSFSNPDYVGASGTVHDVITPRAALVNYIGQQIWVTSGTSSTTAQVTLSASVQDPTGLALVGATMTFTDTLSGKVLASGVKVAPVVGKPDTGTANTIVTLSTGQYGSAEYIILVTMTGPYTNAAQPTADKTASVVVMTPAAANSIIGGGTFTHLSNAAGTYAGSGSPTFSVGLNYNKSLTNIQGKIMLTVPQSDGSFVYINSNSLSSMTVTGTTTKYATVYAKASLYRIDQFGVTTTIDGGASLRVDVVDPGSSGDQIGFTVLSSKNSNMWYSNNWILSGGTVWKTVAEALSTGALTIN